MARQFQRQFCRPVAHPTDPAGVYIAMRSYIAHLRAKGNTDQTIYNYERYLRDFIAWTDAREILKVADITDGILEEYLYYLQKKKSKTSGDPLAWCSKEGKLIPLRSLFRWLARTGRLTSNPAVNLYLADRPNRIPPTTLTAVELDKIFASPDTSTHVGIRDRAMLEVLFSSGIRRMELWNLRLSDVNFQSQTLRVRHGKGNKQRVVPISQSALTWIARYSEIRQPTGPEVRDVLFLTKQGERFSLAWIGTVIGDNLRRALPGRSGSCHLMRHTMATAMLDNDADIRFIQEILGHAQLSTTQFYTQVSQKKLREVYLRCHPAAQPKMTRPVESVQRDISSSRVLPIDKISEGRTNDRIQWAVIAVAAICPALPSTNAEQWVSLSERSHWGAPN